MGKNTNQAKDLLKLNDELENYFRNTVIPQLFVDANLILRKFTPPALKQFDLSFDDLGRHINDVTTKIRYPTIHENIAEVIESSQSLEKEIQTTDLKWYQMNILPYIIKKENKTNGVIITFIGITDRIEVLKKYERLNLNYETIIYALSHDLNGPLTNIQELVKLLETIPLKENEEAGKIFNMLSLSVEKLRKTIEDLTEISRNIIDFEEAPEQADFESLIKDAQLALKSTILKTDAKITTNINVPKVTSSRKNIRSIIYNLLSNAIKYRALDRTPEVSIKTERLNSYILLSVSDNGIGIEEDKQEMIFHRYTRLRNDVEGTGTGLFIVKRMVDDIGGKVEVESTLGEGSTFKVYFKE